MTCPRWLIYFLYPSTIALMGGEDGMESGYHTPEQIVRKLREADRLLGEGTPLVGCLAPGSHRGDVLPLAKPVRRHES